MQIRRISIHRFRGIEQLQFSPGPATLILGPNNAGKSTILDALDLLLHSGVGRPRRQPEDVDYYRRLVSEGFEIEAVLGDMSETFMSEVHHHLEGWNADTDQLVAEPDGEGVEPVVRVRVRGTPELDLIHEFAKPEAASASFHRRLREQVGWVFDGHRRDPSRQLSFYQGALLERLFGSENLEPVAASLSAALATGAESVNHQAVVESVLSGLSSDMADLGLIDKEENAAFETGDLSQRALLQTLRLAVPSDDNVLIPLARQGRGVQRLVLVATLLRIAESTNAPLIGGFEEPEEALEPLRQLHLAQMLLELATSGGQVFVVTHSPDVARNFRLDDILLVPERTGGTEAVHLSDLLSPPIRQTYERWLDGALVRGLFCRVPLLVEGPSDRAVFEVFWDALAADGNVIPRHRAGLDVLTSEGVSNVPMLAKVLTEIGKPAAAWLDQDTPDVRREIGRLRTDDSCAALILHSSTPHQDNLEHALASHCSIPSLSLALHRLAEDRLHSWENQLRDLVSRCEGVGEAERQRAASSTSIQEFLSALDPSSVPRVVASALGAKKVTPFEMKGGRQGRIVAEAIVESEGVPTAFATSFVALNDWIAQGCSPSLEIEMSGDAGPAT